MSLDPGSIQASLECFHRCYREQSGIDPAVMLEQLAIPAEDENEEEGFFDEPLLRMVRHEGIAPTDRVLDAGCGLGVYSARLAADFLCHVTAVDYAAEQLKETESFLASEGFSNDVRCVSASLTDLPFEDESFDVVWCRDVLAHIPDAEKALSEMIRVLAPEGRLFLMAALGTDKLWEDDLQSFMRWLTVSRDSLDRKLLEKTLRVHQISIVHESSMTDPESPWYEDFSAEAPAYEDELKRLLSSPVAVEDVEAWREWETTCAIYRWNVKAARGVIDYRLYLAEKPSA